MNPSPSQVTANRHVTIGSGASHLSPPPTVAIVHQLEVIKSILERKEREWNEIADWTSGRTVEIPSSLTPFVQPPLPVETPPPSPPLTLLPPECSFEETVLKMKQLQREWTEYMDRLHPPPSPPLLAEIPSSVAPFVVAAPAAAISVPDLLRLLPPSPIAKPDLLHPPVNILSLSPPEPTEIPPSPPSPTKPPLLSTVSSLVVELLPVPSCVVAAQQTLTLAAWAQQVVGGRWAQQMGLEAQSLQLKPKSEIDFVLYPMEMKTWAEEGMVKPKFYIMHVLLKIRVGIG